jgi:hypothetical protein
LYIKFILVLVLTVVVQRELIARWPRIWFTMRCGLLELRDDPQLHERLIVEGQELCRQEYDPPTRINAAGG